jgi:hypothetical protein
MSSKAHMPNTLKPIILFLGECECSYRWHWHPMHHISFLCTFHFICHWLGVTIISKCVSSIVFNQEMSWGCSTFDMWDNVKRSNPVSCDWFTTCIVTWNLCPTNRWSDGYSTTYFPLCLHACNKCESEQRTIIHALGYIAMQASVTLVNVVASQMLVLKYLKICQTFTYNFDAT